jgi:hypothetical protein
MIAAIDPKLFEGKTVKIVMSSGCKDWVIFQFTDDTMVELWAEPVHGSLPILKAVRSSVLDIDGQPVGPTGE